MSECKSCNQKPSGKFQYGTITLGFYLLGAAIYGTYKIVEDLIGLFN